MGLGMTLYVFYCINEVYYVEDSVDSHVNEKMMKFYKLQNQMRKTMKIWLIKGNLGERHIIFVQ